jgi:hypothetical protein
MGIPGLAKNEELYNPTKKEIYETIETIILLRIGGINVYWLPVLQKSTLPAGC